ncbi:unnamed protein product, partial [Prorocentrum cordatum]
VRHGAASHAAAVEGLDLAAVQERLRHAHLASTLRCRKHVQHLRLIDAVPAAVMQWAEAAEQQLRPALRGRGRERCAAQATARKLRRLGRALIADRAQLFLEIRFGSGEVAAHIPTRDGHRAGWIHADLFISALT